MKPEALRLAALLEFNALLDEDTDAAAAELRRLHAVNVELLEALRPVAVRGEISSKIIENARAAIAKAEGK
jgi:hypothetical protein